MSLTKSFLWSGSLVLAAVLGMADAASAADVAGTQRLPSRPLASGGKIK
jgi:hypothetical protein